MQRAFDEAAVKQVVADAIAVGGRGVQSALARHVGVEPQTVNKWAKHQTCPAIQHWSAIEAFFDWEPGRLHRVAGLASMAGDERATHFSSRLARMPNHVLQAIEDIIDAEERRQGIR